MGETHHPSVVMSPVDSGRENVELDLRGTGQGDVKRRRETRTLGSEKEKQQPHSLAITEEDLQ